jgi:hypothetical protein
MSTNWDTFSCYEWDIERYVGHLGDDDWDLNRVLGDVTDS